MYPKEFRIKLMREPGQETLDRLQHFVRLQTLEQIESRDPEFHTPSSINNISDKTLSELGTYLWRIKERMVDRETGQPSEPNRRTFRHVQSAWDLLAENGIRILDHTDDIVPEGGIYSLKAIAYEPRDGLLRETVVETIKPTIYFQDRMIQMGEVIIGTPANS